MTPAGTSIKILVGFANKKFNANGEFIDQGGRRLLRQLLENLFLAIQAMALAEHLPA